jgi:hypothetical protein
MLPVRASTTFSGSVAWAGASGKMVFSCDGVSEMAMTTDLPGQESRPLPDGFAEAAPIPPSVLTDDVEERRPLTAHQHPEAARETASAELPVDDPDVPHHISPRDDPAHCNLQPETTN